MIKEVEIRARHYFDIVGRVFDYDDMEVEDPTKQLINGVLSDEGKWLDLNMNINSPSNSGITEIIALDYNVVDYSNRQVILNNVYPLTSVQGTTAVSSYSIDLSPVLDILTKVETIPTNMKTIFQLFTYEANIETAYGSKRLSVPYNTTIDKGTYTLDSTDGLYTLYYCILRPWLPGIPFIEGQLTSYGDGVYVALTGSTDVEPGTNEDVWVTATMEDLRKFASGTTTGLETSTLICGTFDMLISRNIKQTVVNDLLSRMNYKDQDDQLALSVLNTILRKAKLSVVALEEGEPIKARYYLDKILTDYQHSSGNDIEKVVITKSAYTL